MKRHTLLLAVAVAALLPSALRAQQYTGTSGLIHIPSAEMHHEGDALIGGHYLNQHMMPDTGFIYNGKKYNTFDYYLALTPFRWLELSYTCTERIRSMQGDEITKWSKDRYASVKIRPVEEGKYVPAIAIGCNDIGTSAFNAPWPTVASTGDTTPSGTASWAVSPSAPPSSPKADSWPNIQAMNSCSGLKPCCGVTCDCRPASKTSNISMQESASSSTCLAPATPATLINPSARKKMKKSGRFKKNAYLCIVE